MLALAEATAILNSTPSGEGLRGTWLQLCLVRCPVWLLGLSASPRNLASVDLPSLEARRQFVPFAGESR